MSISTRSDPPSTTVRAVPAPRQTPLLPAQIAPAIDEGTEQAPAAIDLPPSATVLVEGRTSGRAAGSAADSADRSSRREAAARQRALRQARQRDAQEQAAREREQAFLRALATSGLPLR